MHPEGVARIGQADNSVAVRMTREPVFTDGPLTRR